MSKTSVIFKHLHYQVVCDSHGSGCMGSYETFYSNNVREAANEIEQAGWRFVRGSWLCKNCFKKFRA